MSIPTEGLGSQTDATKLVSLLALATGAVAMPQTGQADIIYTDLSSSPVAVNYSSAPFWFTVPGTAQVGFFGAQQTVTTTYFSVQTYKYRLVVAGISQGSAGAVGGDGNFVQHLPPGATWDQPAGLFYNIPVGYASDGGVVNPIAGYNNRYMAWSFVDDSLQTPAERYGWAEINLSVAGYNAGGPTVTVLRYGFDDTGAKPTMGQTPIPEPTSGALLVMGAMALGARGLRKWRQTRQPADQA
jgi:hypothetical protein